MTNGQRHAIGAMPFGHAAEGPERMLQPLAESSETLAEADVDMLPVGVGEDPVEQQVVEGLLPARVLSPPRFRRFRLSVSSRACGRRCPQPQSDRTFRQLFPNSHPIHASFLLPQFG